MKVLLPEPVTPITAICALAGAATAIAIFATAAHLDWLRSVVQCAPRYRSWV